MDKAKEVHCKVIKNRIFVVQGERSESLRMNQQHVITKHQLQLYLHSNKRNDIVMHEDNDILMDFPSSREGEESSVFQSLEIRN